MNEVYDLTEGNIDNQKLYDYHLKKDGTILYTNHKAKKSELLLPLNKMIAMIVYIITKLKNKYMT